VLGRYREIRPVHSGRLLGKPLDVNVVISSSSARAATYTISSYHGGLAEVPCDAFKKNADGSWTQIAILIGGALIPAGSNFKNTAESRIIEKKCDKEWGSVPPAMLAVQISWQTKPH
jgi:hypothetical protein